MSPFRNSLIVRLMALIALWLVMALVVTGLLLSTFFRSNAERSFRELLNAHTFNVMGAVDLDESGTVGGLPNLGDPRFLQPASGWYWAVSKASSPTDPLVFSPSITKDGMERPPANAGPFSEEFRRSYTVMSETGLPLERVEAQLYLGDTDDLYQITVAGNRLGLERAISEFNQQILLFFSVFGLLTLVALYLAVWFGLRPLKRARSALNRVREGQAERLEGHYPREIAPIVDETNALISANRNVMERARTQVGNLAHALKTPLAVILNESRSEPKDQLAALKRVGSQATTMQDQVRHYLERAQISAQRGVTTANTDVLPVVQRMMKVMAKLNPNVEFELDGDETVNWRFRGEAHDLEEALGNLLENAAIHCTSAVRLTIDDQNTESLSRSVHIAVEDDGAGLTDTEMKLAVQRGKRLDESKPGSGLGLAIVRDITGEYHGVFELGKSELGGLRASMFLPRA